MRRIDPADLRTIERYKLLIGIIVPRPIAFVSTVSPDGVTNLAPFSFFNGVGSNPMTLLFCPASRPDGTDKDTLRNLLPPAEGGVGEFVVNAAVESYARQVAAAADEMSPEESEFDLTGLTPVPSERVTPPRVAEAPFSFECKTLQVIRTNPGQPLAGNVVIGEVVYMHAVDGLIDERYRTDPVKLGAIGRMGGRAYSRAEVAFELNPDRSALESDAP